MVDCFDRIAVQMTELALEPVRMLAQRQMLGAVSLRTPSGGKRFLVTVAKRFPAGEGSPARYTWSIEEIAADGTPATDGARSHSAANTTYGDPEAAYWEAVGRLCTL